jgi:23S rRNA pseudouridine955/2504/2580 synthase
VGSGAVNGVFVAAVTGLAGWFAVDGQLSIGGFIAAVGLTQALLPQMQAITSTSIPNLANARASSARILDTLRSTDTAASGYGDAMRPQDTALTAADMAAPRVGVLEVSMTGAPVRAEPSELVGVRADDRTAARIADALLNPRAADDVEVRLDGVRAREGSIRILAGQELYVPWEEPGAEPRVRNWGPVPVLWRGENVLIVNKPANLLVQPDVKGGDSVVTRVWGMFGTGCPGFSPTAVHRLDRNTTGVLAVALTGEALRGLERLFKERLLTKRYLAVTVGLLPEKGLVDAPLLKDEAAGIVRVDKNGKTARTRYERLGHKCLGHECLAASGEFSSSSSLSLASIELLTGRTHQARAHLAYAGYPILGDRKYGDIKTNRRWKAEARRPLLHAFELGFPDDLTGALLELSGRTFRAEPPDDMARFIWT